ncbi:unnamed protein product [Penicillium salamii]|nr:unnamed protein product [Penicillium salamii]
MGNWVYILDNINNNQLLCSVPITDKQDLMSGSTIASTKSLLEYIPRNWNNSIIIISQTKKITLKTFYYNNLIKIKPIENSEVLKLLQKKLEQPEKSQES